MTKSRCRGCRLYDWIVDDEGRITINECTKRFVIKGEFLHIDDRSIDVEDRYVKTKVALMMGIHYASVYSAARTGSTRIAKRENGSYMFNIAVYEAIRRIHRELDEKMQNIKEVLYDMGIPFSRYARYISERTGVSERGISVWWSEYSHVRNKGKLKTKVALYKVLIACMFEEFVEKASKS